MPCIENMAVIALLPPDLQRSFLVRPVPLWVCEVSKSLPSRPAADTVRNVEEYVRFYYRTVDGKPYPGRRERALASAAFRDSCDSRPYGHCPCTSCKDVVSKLRRWRGASAKGRCHTQAVIDILDSGNERFRDGELLWRMRESRGPIGIYYSLKPDLHEDEFLLEAGQIFDVKWDQLNTPVLRRLKPETLGMMLCNTRTSSDELWERYSHMPMVDLAVPREGGSAQLSAALLTHLYENDVTDLTRWKIVLPYISADASYGELRETLHML